MRLNRFLIKSLIVIFFLQSHVCAQTEIDSLKIKKGTKKVDILNKLSISYRLKSLANGKKIYRGVGVRLSIVKNLVEQMNGDIYLESEFNKGTTFSFTIPYIYTG